MKIQCCEITATVPHCVTKEFSLVNGLLEKKTTASVTKGSMRVMQFADPHEFSALLQSLQPNQCLTYGIPPRDAGLVTDEEWKGLNCPDDPLPRAKSIFAWPSGPGILMLDYDAPKDGTKPFGKRQLVETLLKACPELEASGLIWWPSTSSNIFAGEEEITGLKGQRIYLFVQDARDIERAGKVLNDRLWAMGYGRYEVSDSGSLLMRSVFDHAVWQTNRIDFAAGAKCGPGLLQRRGEPVVFIAGPSFNLLDSRTAMCDLTPEEASLAADNKNKAASQLKTKVEEVKSTWLRERGKALRLFNPILTNDAAIAMAHRAIESRDLMGDWPIFIKGDDGSKKEITVLEALDNPERYEGGITLDPLEPDYDGGRWVGKLYLCSDRSNLFSFAHGGVNFRLHRGATHIEIVNGKGRETTDALLTSLRQSPDIFDFGQELVKVGQAGALSVLDENSLRYFAGGLCQFYQMKKSAFDVMTKILRDPPPAICKSVISLHSQRQLKKLSAVITAPTLRPDGTIFDTPGYDPKTQLLFDPVGLPPHITRFPTRALAMTALEQLWIPFAEFPFCNNIDRAVHLAALLTASVRSSLPASPGFAYDAPVQASGKTLLARCVGVLVQGTDPSVWPHTAGRDDEEIRKRLLTVLRTGSRVLIWDNVVGTFDSPALASCMTSPMLSDRILGQSRMSTVPNKLLLLMTGNNLSLRGEMPRRILISRIDPKTDKPFARQFALEPYAYCHDHRQCMLAAALTLIRAYITHRCEKPITGRLASFENWDDWVRGAVIYANELKPGMFGDVMDSIDANQAADPDIENLLCLLSSWEKIFGTKAVSTTEILAVVYAGASPSPEKLNLVNALEVLTNSDRFQISARGLGKFLGYRLGRIAGGRVLEKGPMANDRQTWRVSPV